MERPNPRQAGTEYLEGKVATASPTELVRILYEIVLNEIGQARRMLASGDPLGRSAAVSKAVQGLTELILGLDQDKGGERSQRLREIYGYLQNELLRGHGEQSDDRFASVASVLEVMYRNWVETCSMLASQASPVTIATEAAPEPEEAPATQGRWQLTGPDGGSSRGWEA